MRVAARFLERARRAALLVDEDERARRARYSTIPALDEDTADAGRRGQARDDDDRRLLARRQVGNGRVRADDERGDGVQDGDAHGAHPRLSAMPDGPARR